MSGNRIKYCNIAILVFLCMIFGYRSGYHRFSSLVVMGSVLILAFKLHYASPILRSGLLTLGISVKLSGVFGIWIYLIYHLYDHSIQSPLSRVNSPEVAVFDD